MKKDLHDNKTIQQNSISQGMFWKLTERFGVTSIQFILQVILARILDPEHYGALSILFIFITLANVFVQNGFNTALIQNKDITEEDYSSVFWVSLCITIVLYIIIFFAAPSIARFYSMPEIKTPLRVMALMLFPGTLNSIQLAKVSREMNFRKVFYSNIGGVLTSGIVGIIIALCGGGLWALVIQSMVNIFIVCFVMHFTVDYKIQFVCDLKRIRILFSYGWKLLVSSLIDTLFNEIRSLIIGKKYNSDTLGYYNRGKQFPQFIINAVNGAVQSVMLPAMSAEQERISRVKFLVRNSITISAFVIFPMMAGMAAVAPSLISILLTDKWLPCVPYMQLYCFTLAFMPIHSCNLQAINALGKSDVFLKLEVLKKTIAIIIIIIAVLKFDSAIAIAMTGVINTIISCFINAYPNKRLLRYSYVEQMKDIGPILLSSVIMFIVVYSIGELRLNVFILLLLQIIVGIIFYVLISLLMKLEPLNKVISIVLKK